MIDHEEDQLLDHEYDGIQELDNLLPRWWLYLFYVTIVFSALYLAYYHVLGIGLTQEEQFLAEVNPEFEPDRTLAPLEIMQRTGYHTPLYNPEADRRREAVMAGMLPEAPASAPLPQEPIEFEEPLTSDQALQAGQKIYMANCASCHGNEGGGGIGPNLTDDYWLHGNTFADTVRVVVEGVPVKGMISWRGQLTPEQIHEVSTYIYQLRGTAPPNAKGPQGQEY